MKFDLKWILPFTTPFIMVAMYRLLCLAAGAAYQPDVSLLLSLFPGIFVAIVISMLIGKSPDIWPVRISKKGQGDE